MPASLPTIVQVELPFDLDAFIRRQNEENKRVLDQIIKAQQEERENLYRNMQLIADSQREDRQFFNRSLVLVLAGAGGIVLLPLLVILALVLIRRRSAVRTTAMPEGRIGLTQGPALLLEAADAVEETEYLGEEHYSEIVRAKRLGELYKEFVGGNLTWDVVSEYISELNHELKEEILRVVERKIDSPDAGDLEATLPVLLPLITDEGRGISDRSRRLAGRVGSARHISYSEQREGLADSANEDDPLSLSSLFQIARLVDNKSGIHKHSIRVAEISFQIAVQLADPRVDPDTARKVALVHNIGYLDIDDQLFRYEGSLTEEQFAVVKSHPERGIRLLEYADPPEIFIQGIRHHHERLDGSGYPQGLPGEQIPLIARIIAVADSFAAATSPRPYRKALSVSLCLKMMEKVAGTLLDEGIFQILFDLCRDRLDDEP